MYREEWQIVVDELLKSAVSFFRDENLTISRKMKVVDFMTRYYKEVLIDSRFKFKATRRSRLLHRRANY